MTHLPVTCPRCAAPNEGTRVRCIQCHARLAPILSDRALRSIGWTLFGVLAGIVAGFALAPVIPRFGAPLAVSTIIGRGADLGPFTQDLRVVAERSFAYVIACAFLGGLIAFLYSLRGTYSSSRMLPPQGHSHHDKA